MTAIHICKTCVELLEKISKNYCKLSINETVLDKSQWLERIINQSDEDIVNSFNCNITSDEIFSNNNRYKNRNNEKITVNGYRRGVISCIYDRMTSLVSAMQSSEMAKYQRQLKRNSYFVPKKEHMNPVRYRGKTITEETKNNLEETDNLETENAALMQMYSEDTSIIQ
eukprot:GHVL01034675.1.p1 GENE.GHVL01034675.1~~GHVL01034675.1.p1  ORF type:complete len:169 (+),score=47.87 GHVL01034675.1:133-639(+)